MNFTDYVNSNIHEAVDEEDVNSQDDKTTAKIIKKAFTKGDAAKEMGMSRLGFDKLRYSIIEDIFTKIRRGTGRSFNDYEIFLEVFKWFQDNWGIKMDIDEFYTAELPPKLKLSIKKALQKNGIESEEV